MNLKHSNSTSNAVSHLAVPGIPKHEVPSLLFMLATHICIGKNTPLMKRREKSSSYCAAREKLAHHPQDETLASGSTFSPKRCRLSSPLVCSLVWITAQDSMQTGRQVPSSLTQ